MDILEEIQILERIIIDKSFSIEKATEEINHLNEKMLSEVAPASEISAASEIIRRWGDEFMQDLKNKFEIIEDYAEYLRRVAEKINQDMDRQLERSKKVLKASRIDPNNINIQYLIENPQKVLSDLAEIKEPDIDSAEITEPSKPLKSVNDFSTMNKTVMQSPFIGKLDLFIKSANKALIQARHRFKFLKILLNVSKALLICFGFVLSYFLGEKLHEILGHYKIEIDHLWIDFAVFIVCFMTSDKWLEKLKEIIFWKYAKRICSENKVIYTNFLGLKVEFIINANAILNTDSSLA